jgi:hypothetical protein
MRKMLQERSQNPPGNGSENPAVTTALANAPEAFGDELQGMVEYLERQVNRALYDEQEARQKATAAHNTWERLTRLSECAKALRDSLKTGGDLEQLPL